MAMNPYPIQGGSPGVQLQPGERVLWSGQPAQGLIFRPIDAGLVPFSLLWGGFALFWNVGVWAGGAPLFFRLWGLPFLIAGLYVTVGRFFHARHLRSKISYTLTDRRAIIRSKPSTRDMPLTPQTSVETSVRSNGTGTLMLSNGGGRHSAFSGNIKGAQALWLGVGGSNFDFDGIDNVEAVADLVNSIVYDVQDR